MAIVEVRQREVARDELHAYHRLQTKLYHMSVSLSIFFCFRQMSVSNLVTNSKKIVNQ